MPLCDDNQHVFAQRRARALEALGDDGALLLFAARHHNRNADAEYRFRQHSDVLYLTGWTDPEAAVLLLPGADAPFVLFVQPKNPELEIWTGIRPGPVGAVDRFGADAAFDIAELSAKLPELLSDYRTLFYDVMADAENDALVAGALARARRAARKTRRPVPDAFVAPGRVLHPLRLHKTTEELALLREAARITAEAHLAVMRDARPGGFEYELEALLDYTFRRHGGTGAGYTSIVGGGHNACILHYIENDDSLHAGDLLLVDAGCEYGWYTADVTRTFPVDGRFTDAQRALYEVVLDAQVQAIDAVRPGRLFKEGHDTAVRVLTEGMVRLGLLDGEVDELIEREAFKRYYMHGTGHFLGLDVHDVGPFVGEEPVLAPGMVVTVEPGLYVAPDDEDAPERFRGLGIRIEDDVLCTEHAPDVLTAAIPKTVADVEAACRA